MRPFTLFIQLCGHNRARQRDKLSHLLEDYAALQDEVFNIILLGVFRLRCSINNYDL